MKKKPHLFLQICSIILLVAILAVVIINNRLIVNNQEEVDTSISNTVENISTTKNSISTTTNVVSSTNAITKTTTDPKNIVTASDVLALPGVSELVGSISTEENIVGRFMYCCTNNTYYLLSNENIVDSFETKIENDFILVEDIIIYYTDDTIYYWPILDSSTHLISDVIGEVSWPLSEENVDDFLYQYHLEN